MNFQVIIFYLSVIIIQAAVDVEWSAYKRDHSKNYTNAENIMRYNIWRHNMKEIKDSNKTCSFITKINRFGDWTQNEINKRLLGFKPTFKPKSVNLRKTPMDTLSASFNRKSLPDYVDWSEHEMVTPARDQTIGNNMCSSSYVFAATAALEGYWTRRYNTLQSMSEQNFLDCSVSGAVLDKNGVVEPYSGSGNVYQFTADGCDGGSPEAVFQYFLSNTYVPLAQLPYTGEVISIYNLFSLKTYE